MAAVVHHGGSGTTGFALRAGVPSLVVPFLFDHFFWGRRTANLGVGPQPIPFRKLSAARLSTASEMAVEDKQRRRRAVKLGQKIHAENGLNLAVREIERMASSGYPGLAGDQA